jgi:hypothetical protein
MLQRFLQLMNDGQHHSLGDIAADMGISEALAGEMAEKLTQLGYLQAVGSGTCGDSACAECPVGGACLTGGRRGYIPTGKGS